MCIPFHAQDTHMKRFLLRLMIVTVLTVLLVQLFTWLDIPALIVASAVMAYAVVDRWDR